MLQDYHHPHPRSGINATNLSEYPRIGWKRSGRPANSVTSDFMVKDVDSYSHSSNNGNNMSLSSGRRRQIIVPHRITFGAEHNLAIFDEIEEDDNMSDISMHSDALPITAGASARPVIYDRPQSAPQSSPLLKARMESRASVQGGGRSPYSRLQRPASAKASVASHDSGHDSIAAMYNDKGLQKYEEGSYSPRLGEWLDAEHDFTNVQDVLNKLKDDSQSSSQQNQHSRPSKALSKIDLFTHGEEYAYEQEQFYGKPLGILS